MVAALVAYKGNVLDIGISRGSPQKQNQKEILDRYIYLCINHLLREKLVYYKKLAHMVMRADTSPKIHQMSLQAEELMASFPVWVQRWEETNVSAQRQAKRANSPLLNVFVYSGLRWMRTSTLEKATCFTLPTHSNINLFENYPHRTPRMKFNQVFGHPWPRQVDA